YFEDGVLKGTCEYENDFGKHVEYYHSGKVYGTGPKSGTANAGHWRYFDEDGSLQAEGDFMKGRKHGKWSTYYHSGKLSSEGAYENDEPVGPWTYYFENGSISSSGVF